MENFLKSAYFHKNKKWITCILLLMGLFARAQETNLNTILSSFNQYTQKNIQEKLFLQTDKSFYITGEILWFKLYVVDGAFHKPLSLSKVAYVEIINTELKPVLQGKIAVSGGSGNGSFLLPASLPSGNYKIRAYTNWMKNTGPDYFFEADISIVNIYKKLGERLPEKSTGYDIQFFPEGGNLVDGIPARVGFKVIDQNGKGIDASGMIIDQDKKTVANFASLKFGMGRFSFTPSANNQYTAFLKVGGNNVTVADLPKVSQKGYVLKVDAEENGQITATVFCNNQFTEQTVYLLIHTRGKVKFARALTLNNGKASFQMPAAGLGEGITSFTIFDYAGRPVCERLFFKRPAAFVVSIQSDQEEYANRKKVMLDIGLPGSSRDSTMADLSLSVYQLDSLQLPPTQDIRSYLWMGSDIRGAIESPEYYFNDQEENTGEATDNLMLTQGWRRFKWEEVLQDKNLHPEFVPEYSGHLINGKVTDKKTGLPVAFVTTYAAVPGDKYELGCSISNKKGLVQYDLKKIFGSNELIIQTENTKDSIYAIDIANPFSEKFATSLFPAFAIPEHLGKEILSHSISTQVQGSFGIANLRKFNPLINADSTSFYGEPDKKFFLDDYTRFNTMEEVVREYIGGVILKRHQQKFHFRLMDEPLRIFFDQDPMMLLDGVPVFDADQIIAADPLKIKKIEIITRKYFQGSLVANGIISLASYTNDLEGFLLNPHSQILEYEGLQLQREFYSPEYDEPTQSGSRIPDFRNVLYWNPNMRVSEMRNTKIGFYTSDRKGKYIGVIQGITSEGKPGSGYVYFEVR